MHGDAYKLNFLDALKTVELFKLQCIPGLMKLLLSMTLVCIKWMRVQRVLLAIKGNILSIPIS